MAHSMMRITRTEMLGSLLPDLGVPWTDSRTFRAVHRAVGIESEKRSRSGERGGVVCYERPVSALTIASVDFRVGSSPSGSPLLEPFRELGKRYSTDMGEDPPHTDLRFQTNAILELDGDIDFVAELLLIGSPDLGMDPATRNGHFEANPRLLGVLGDGWVTVAALRAWDEAYLSWARYGEGGTRTLSQKRDTAAFAFLKHFGGEILKHREDMKNWPPLVIEEGGAATSTTS